MRCPCSLAAAAILLAALSGCGKSETTVPEAKPSLAAVPAVPAPISTMPDGSARLPAPGAYVVTTADGKPLAKVTIESDNSYSQAPAGGFPEAGIVKLVDGKLCFDPSGKEKPIRCYTGGKPTGDGGFATINEQGGKEIVRPVAP